MRFDVRTIRSILIKRMTGYLACGVTTLLLLCCRSRIVTGITLAPVHWNSSNPLFKQSRNSATIEVNLYDQIDFVCPFHSPDHSDSSLDEYYAVYQVTKWNYDSCNLSPGDSSTALIVNCSNPLHQKRFTILFEMFQAIPNVPEFVPGSTYYYISTSTGSSDGLANTYLGACRLLNMRLTVHVCCDSHPGLWIQQQTKHSSSCSNISRHLMAAKDVDVAHLLYPGVGLAPPEYDSGGVSALLFAWIPTV